jgi:hypothetical protein
MFICEEFIWLALFHNTCAIPGFPEVEVVFAEYGKIDDDCPSVPDVPLTPLKPDVPDVPDVPDEPSTPEII